MSCSNCSDLPARIAAQPAAAERARRRLSEVLECEAAPAQGEHNGGYLFEEAGLKFFVDPHSEEVRYSMERYAYATGKTAVLGWVKVNSVAALRGALEEEDKIAASTLRTRKLGTAFLWVRQPADWFEVGLFSVLSGAFAAFLIALLAGEHNGGVFAEVLAGGVAAVSVWCAVTPWIAAVVIPRMKPEWYGLQKRDGVDLAEAPSLA